MLNNFLLGLFILFTLRGWLVVNLNIPSQILYPLFGFLLVAMSVYGYIIRSTLTDVHLIAVKNLIKLNLLMGVYFVFSEYILGGLIDISFAYIFLAPYLVFVFMRLPVSGINIAFIIIAIGLVFSIFENFYNSVILGGGYNYLMDYNLEIRPDFDGVGTSGGDNFRIGGVTGSFHDSANILGMLGVYFFIKFLISRSYKFLFMTLLVFVAILLTYSAANIILAVFICISFSLYIMYRLKSTWIYNVMLAMFAIILLIIYIVPELFGFIDRAGPEGDYEGMMLSLSIGMLSSPHFWLGHGVLFNSEWMFTEVAFLKGIHQFGIIPATWLYGMLIYPLWFYLKNSKRFFSALPNLAAIVFGFSSLLHYASLFRITNVAIFFAMYALFLTHILSEYDNYQP